MSDTFSKVEVITGVARRRRFSFPTDLKLAVVAETMQPGMSVSYVARRHGLSPSLVFRWRQLMSEGGKEAVRADDEVVAASEVRRLEERVRGLERLLGRKTMEVEILKEALDLARAKKPILLSPSPLPGIPGEGGQRDTRCGPLECRRAPGQQEAAARPTRATRRCRACWRNPPLCRRASDLRVPEDRRAPQARAAIRRFAPGQCQARLPADEKAWPFA
jgi:transposase